MAASAPADCALPTRCCELSGTMWVLSQAWQGREQPCSLALVMVNAPQVHVQHWCLPGSVGLISAGPPVPILTKQSACAAAGGCLTLAPPSLPPGRTRITLRRTGELYSHVPPNAKVHNLVLGKTWIDSYGTFLVNCVTTGVRVEVEFKACGWFGSGQYEFEGLVLDAEVGEAAAGWVAGWDDWVRPLVQ